jgi:UrcA family protein
MFRTVLASLVLVASASAVHAQAYETAPTVVVKYADLNIHTTAGANALVERLDNAVRVSCGGSTLDRFDLGRIQEFTSCRQTAMSNAVAKINSPLVYAAAHVPQQGQMAQR